MGVESPLHMPFSTRATMGQKREVWDVYPRLTILTACDAVEGSTTEAQSVSIAEGHKRRHHASVHAWEEKERKRHLGLGEQWLHSVRWLLGVHWEKQV